MNPKKRLDIHLSIPLWQPTWFHNWRAWLPSRGNVVFTLLVVIVLFWAQSAGAFGLGRTNAPTTSTGTIAYQGRLADSAGNPLTGTYPMIFRLYNTASGGAPLWEEQWTGSNSVAVSDGLFNVMLGSLNAIPQSVITGNNSLWLGITIGTDDEMVPRVQLGSVPYAFTVPDSSVTTAKIADGAVTQAKLGADVSLVPPDGSITTAKLADGAVTTVKLNVDNGLGMNGNLTLTGNIFAGGDTWLDRGHRLVVGDFGNGNPAWFGTELEANKWWLSILAPTSYPAGSAGWNGIRFLVGGGPSTAVMTIDPVGNVSILGNLVAGGTKSAVVETENYGTRKFYAVESPEVRFTDEGLAQMTNGLARVELEPIFLETIEGEYLIHLTAYGDATLYVAEVGDGYFVVKVYEGDPNVTFAWMLSAHRKGYSDMRLEEVERPK